MIYDFRCTNCQNKYSVWQNMSDIHQYKCPVCGGKCIREWNNTPVTGKGFYTEQFTLGGEWVSGTKEYDKKLAKTRTLSGMDKFLGVNQAKEEYVEARCKKIEADRQRAVSEIAETEEHISKLRKKGRMD